MVETDIVVKGIKELADVKKQHDAGQIGLKKRELALATEVRNAGKLSAETKGAMDTNAELRRIQKSLHFTGNSDVKADSTNIKMKENDVKYWRDKVETYTKQLQKCLTENREMSTINELKRLLSSATKELAQAELKLAQARRA